MNNYFQKKAEEFIKKHNLDNLPGFTHSFYARSFARYLDEEKKECFLNPDCKVCPRKKEEIVGSVPAGTPIDVEKVNKILPAIEEPQKEEIEELNYFNSPKRKIEIWETYGERIIEILSKFEDKINQLIRAHNKR